MFRARKPSAAIAAALSYVLRPVAFHHGLGTWNRDIRGALVLARRRRSLCKSALERRVASRP